MRIMLWGSRGSGKTWFIRALPRAFAGLGAALQNDVHLSLNDAASGRLLFQSSPTDIMPTAGTEDHRWRITWRRNAVGTVSITHSHEIVITDNSGDKLMTLGSEEHDPVAYSSLRDATAVVAFLDAEVGLEGAARREELEDRFSVLVRSLHSTSQRKPVTLLICLTKSDLLPHEERSEEPKQVINRYFDLDYRELSHLPNSHDAGSSSYRYFLLSAAGFLDDDNRIANFEEGKLREAGQWNPWRVHVPILFMLEMNERKRLAEAGNAVARFFFAGQRLQSHASHSVHTYLRSLGDSWL